MRLAIVGPRDLMLPVSEIEKVLEKSESIDLEKVSEIVTGDARGVDRSAIKFAKKHGIPWVAFGAGWGRLEKGAGPERNRRLVEYLDPHKDLLIALLDGGKHVGTKNTLSQAAQLGVPRGLAKNSKWSKYREERRERLV